MRMKASVKEGSPVVLDPRQPFGKRVKMDQEVG